ncbi:MAG: FKBP-type peptidyl-prolyl cis-trans isomerase [Armatimonas sp.]
MAKVKIGCGWYVLAVLGVSIWAANKWAPNHVAKAKAAIVAKLPKMPWSRSASPSPVPTPQLATPAPTPENATPSPEPTSEPTPPPSQETPAPLPDSAGGDTEANVTTEDVRVGGGKEAKLGQTVRIRCARLGDGGESLGGSSDFLFMLGADEVAPGLDKAVLGMKSGGKRKATIPADAAKGLLPPGVDAEGGSLSIEIELAEVL